MSGPTLFERFAGSLQQSNMTIVACPQCGTGISTPEESHRRILDLESQVKSLNAKATAAVGKLAAYEEEVRSLRAQCAQLQQRPQTPPLAPSEPKLPPPLAQIGTQTSPPRAPSRLASLSSFLPGRRRDLSGETVPPSPMVSSNQSMSDLNVTTQRQEKPALQQVTEKLAAAQIDQQSLRDLQTLESSLQQERKLRIRAESSLSQAHTELEELTASLFGQANEMVATERKARARLEERVKMLELRDTEKRRRLDRLEQSLKRIERVRNLVDDPKTSGLAIGSTSRTSSTKKIQHEKSVSEASRSV